MSKTYIIIGGGAAGIAAAYKILETSKTAFVYLFEASGIYGGRAKTDKNAISGLAFDEGCVYIQDPKNPLNPWPRIAKQLNFETVEEDEQYKLRIDIGLGYQTLNVTAIEHVNELRQFIEDSYEENKIYPNKTVICNAPLLNQDEEIAMATSPLGPFTESAEPWQYLASDRGREAEGSWGANLFVKNGLGTLVKTYGEKLKSLYSIRFTQIFKAIKQINYMDGLSVTDTSNKVYVGDACIVTVPVSVLRANKINFIPHLPEPYTTALKYLQLGSYKKIAVQFSKFPAEIEDNVNYYLYNDNPKGVWQYYRLHYFPKNVIIAHTAGSFASALEEKTDNEVFELFKSAIKTAYYNQPEFIAKYGITKWNKNNYILGAYSYTSPVYLSDKNNLTAFNARKQMAKPISKKIYFAGEAYNLSAYGTLHGAYIDGQDAADNALRDTEN